MIVERRWMMRFVVPVVGLIAFVVIWALLVRRSESLFFSAPGDVVTSLRDDYVDGSFVTGHLLPSVSRLLRGWLIAIVFGVAVGASLGSRPSLLPWFDPLIHLARAVPPPALVGVFFLAFGAGDAPKVGLIAFAAVWPILFNAIDAVRAIDPTQRETARALRLSRWDRLVLVKLPSIAPRVFPGIRASLAIALILMVLTEFTSSVNGLGKVLADQRNVFDWDGVWSTLVVLALLGLTLNAALVAVERRIIDWHVSMSGGER